jgi:hypothetical protein
MKPYLALLFFLSQLFFYVAAINEGGFILLAHTWRLSSLKETFCIFSQIFCMVWGRRRLGQTRIQTKHLLCGLALLKVYTTKTLSRHYWEKHQHKSFGGGRGRRRKRLHIEWTKL